MIRKRIAGARKRGEKAFPSVAANANEPVRKIGFIDLMKIADPDRRANRSMAVC